MLKINDKIDVYLPWKPYYRNSPENVDTLTELDEPTHLWCTNVSIDKIEDNKITFFNQGLDDDQTVPIHLCKKVKDA